MFDYQRVRVFLDGFMSQSFFSSLIIHRQTEEDFFKEHQGAMSYGSHLELLRVSKNHMIVLLIVIQPLNSFKKQKNLL